LPANIGNRPGAGGGGTQWQPGNIANRPGAGGGGTQWQPGDIANRPGAGGSGTQWRPGDIANRPGAGGSGTQWQPGDNVRPRPGGIIGNNNIIGSGNNNTINRFGGNINSGNTINNVTQNNYANISNNAFYGHPGYYNGAYGSWYSGNWGAWASAPAAWAAGTTAGWLGAAAGYAYSNPYAAAAPVDSQVYSYSQPIPTYTEPPQPITVVVQAPASTDVADAPAVPGVVAPASAPPAAEPPPDVPEDPKVAEAIPIFDEARALFRKGEYKRAQAKVQRALDILPEDRVMHEFRGLTLFAQGKYTEAAATLYAVLNSGPGWNWDTVKSFYSDPEAYTNQLRALEAHAKANRESADDRFVLAYHYLVLGQNDAAIRELEQVTKLQPKDQLSAQLLAALKPKPADDGRPTPGTG
jgi:hypothetical protein